MKQTKRILSVVLCLLMLVAVVPVMNAGMTASAATFEDINDSSVFLKQEGSSTCTLVAAAMMMRRYAMLRGDTDWSSITEASLKPTAWVSGQGLRLSFSYKDISVNYGTLSANNSNTSTLINLLAAHPEGIALYRHVSNDYQHAVLLTDYADGTFYCAEPLSTRDYGRIPISKAYCVTITGATQYWYVTSAPVSFTPTYANPEVFVSTNKKHYSPNETATWSFDAEDANSVHLYIYKDGNKYFEGQFATNASYSRQLTTNGHYAFYIVAHYSSGDVSSAWNDCNVSELNAYESSGRTLFYTGETVNLKFSATFASSVHLYIYKDGKKFFEGEFKTSDTYSRIISDTGHYSYYIVAHYDTGNEEGVWKDFDVVLPSVQTDKQAYQIGDTAEFSFNSIGANSLHLYIYKDGKKFFEGEFLPSAVYKRVLDSTINYAGDYYCYIISHYDSGNYQSENHFFSVESDHTHSYTASITKTATCSATGIKTYTCSCGDSYTETIPVNAANHVNTKNVAATASTCTVKGYTAGVYCNDCKKYISGHAEQPLAAHQTTTQNAKAATCTAEGYTGDQVCSVCKQTISKGTVIAKKAHTLTTVNQKAAGCTTAGYTGDQYCTSCKQTITRGNTTNALGHADADSNGNCTRCGTHIKDVTPSQPSNPQPNPNACKYCGQVHSGPFGWLIKFFHSILAIFKR